MTAFAITMSIALVLVGVCWAIAWRDAVRMQCNRDEKVEATKLEAVRRVDIEELRKTVREEDAKTWDGVMGLRERMSEVEKAQFGAPRPEERRSRIRPGGVG